MKSELGYFTTIKFLKKYAKKYNKNFAMFSLGWFFDMVVALLIPALLGIMVDEISYYQNIGAFFRVSGMLLTITLFSCVLCYFIYAQHHYLMSMFTYDIRRKVFKHVLKCDSKHLINISTGNIVATILTFSNECLYFLIRNVIHFFNGIIKLIALSSCLFLLDWKIGMFAIVAAPLSVFVSARFGENIKKYGNEQRKQYVGLTSWLLDKLNGVTEIRLLGAKRKVDAEFKDKHIEAFRINYSCEIYNLSANNIVKFFNLCMQLALFAFTGVCSQTGTITIGYFLMVMSYYSLLTRQIGFTSNSILDAQNRIAYIQYLKDFLSFPLEDTLWGKDRLNVTAGEILINNLSFEYGSTRKIFDNINLKIAGGEKIALVGKSGCGKTTLAHILVGLFQPQEGEIYIDNKKLTDCSLRSIRENIGIVSQDVLMFEGTIKENVMLGNLSATEEAVRQACRQAGILSFVEGLPQGLDTIIGKNGVGLSSGQKQRLAIARIYLKNPKIIIFDEATSSLDKDTELEIHRAWKDVLFNRTSIIIAHRKSSVMQCDRVVVLNDGEIVEEGSPSHLLVNGDVFKVLFASMEEN